MASARYTLNIKPEDLKPDEPRQLTKKEKLANWWYYHRLHVAVAAAALAVAVWIAVDLLGRTFPDYQLALVTDQYVPETVVEELQTALVPFCQDLNGDGQVLAEIAAYQLELVSYQGRCKLIRGWEALFQKLDGCSNRGNRIKVVRHGTNERHARVTGVDAAELHRKPDKANERRIPRELPTGDESTELVCRTSQSKPGRLDQHMLNEVALDEERIALRREDLKIACVGQHFERRAWAHERAATA